MHRIIASVGALFIALLVLVPVAAAADPVFGPGSGDGRTLMSVGGPITVPAGTEVDRLIVVSGTATIQGTVHSVWLVNGTANFVGSTSNDVVAIASDVSLDGTSTVTGQIWTIESTVAAAPGSTIKGGIRQGADFATGWLWIGPALFIVYLGFVLAALAGALAFIAFLPRQARAAEAVVRTDPVISFLVGLLALIVLITAGSIAVVTIVGIPLGLAVLLGVVPAMLVVGYAVTGIWVGNWILRRSGREQTGERPYAAAVLGILVVALVSIIPSVGGLIALVGFGAISRLMWNNFRGKSEASAPVPVQAATAPAVG